MAIKDDDSHLGQIKRNVRDAYEYFKDNVIRFNRYKNFTFNTSLNEDDLAKLDELQKPNIEFNVIEAFISRLRGEFALQSPSLAVRAADALPLNLMTPRFLAQMNVVEGIVRHIMFGGSNDYLRYNLYSDAISGGWGVAKAYTDYVNPRSFEQNIYVEKAFDPTLCGFDPLARTSHKGDGAYCFELIPLLKEDFERRYGKDLTKGIKFSRNFGDFSWSFSNGTQKICIVAYYYEKVQREEKIVKLTDGRTILTKHYKQLLEMWDQKGFLSQAPKVVEERKTTLEYIDRHTMCENEVMETEKTTFEHLPLVFFDGNSEIIRVNEEGPSKQMTRPYSYHVLGMQKLMNFCGQTLSADIEGYTQSKFKVALESIVEKYWENFLNPQQESVLVYRAFDKDFPDRALPPPQEVTKMPSPPVVQEMFLNAPKIIQHILGSYDAELGMHGGNTSGVAIENGSLAANAAARPYTVNHIKGLNRLGEIFLTMIPKYYVTPRTVPIVRPNGQHDFIEINKISGKPEKKPQQQQQQQMQPGQEQEQKEEQFDDISTIFDPNTMQITIEAGVNSALAQAASFDQMLRLMDVSPVINEVINSPEGIDTLLSNVNIKGIEELRVKTAEYMKNKSQQPPPPDPATELLKAQMLAEEAKAKQRTIEAMQKNEIDQQRLMLDAASDAEEHAIEKEKLNLEFIKLSSEMELADRKQLLDEHEAVMDSELETSKLLVGVAKDLKESATKNET